MKSEHFSHNPQAAATNAYQRKGVFYFWRLYHGSHNAPGGLCLIAFVGRMTNTSLHRLPPRWPHQKPQLGVEQLPQPLTHSPCTPSRHHRAQRCAPAPGPHPVSVPITHQSWRGGWKIHGLATFSCSGRGKSRSWEILCPCCPMTP